MMNDKILVIATGGTIASIEENKVRVIKDTDYPLTGMYCEFKRRQLFCVKQPYSILSENLNVDYLQKLVQALLKHLSEDIYCGVVISHGTDTLAFTQSLIKYLRHIVHLDIPIEFVFAYTPIPQQKKGEPDFSFKERQKQWDGYKCFQKAVDRIVEINSVRKFELHKLNAAAPVLSGAVFILKAFPGMDASVLNFGTKYKNIIIEGYHSCTVPVDAMKNLADKFEGNIYVCAPESFSEKYDSMKEIEKYAAGNKNCGIVFVAGNITDIWAKLVLGLPV